MAIDRAGQGLLKKIKLEEKNLMSLSLTVPDKRRAGSGKRYIFQGIWSPASFAEYW